MIKLKNNNGFFLIEALIAVLIFTIGILGVLQIQLNSMEATADAQYRVQASYMAENLMSAIILDQANIETYKDKSNEEYESWFTDLRALLPGVDDNPPTITTEEVNGRTMVNIEINWKSPNSELVSKYQLQNILL